MKKGLYLRCVFALLAFIGCSSDKDDVEDDSLNEEVFLSQENMDPEFSKGYDSFRYQTTTNIENDRAEITCDCNGYVTMPLFETHR